MSKPAARIGDMHVCPMVTPGVPPVPHVGGPVTGPGVPTVLIGGMPAAVMGDMCVCVGPPDTIILGSTGVLIGGKPAARMGDTTVHGGSIVVGCSTVLIGEISPGTIMTKTSLTVLEQFAPEREQVTSMQQAAQEGKPFCEICNESGDAGNNTEESEEEKKEIISCYFSDEEDAEIQIDSTVQGKYVYLVIETSNMIGEKTEIKFKNANDVEYNGKLLTNDILNVKINSDKQLIKLKVLGPKS